MDKHNYCVIMCGGIGSRFWPASRESKPKQFLDFMGSGRSLLRMTYDRLLPVVPPENMLVVTNATYKELIHEQLPDLDDSQILFEPIRRNTAPCIAWAAAHIAARDPQASMIVTPSDHLIINEHVFEECIRRGFEFVGQTDALLTLGIKPTRPDTGYGYIQIDGEVVPSIHRVKTFTEKPDRALAEVFLASGEFLWNSGIFMWKAQAIIEAIRQHSPDLAVMFDKGEGKFATPEEKAFIDANFEACPSISIDYAVMEKAENVYVERVDFGWNDLGSWGALYDISPKNSQASVTQRSRVVAYESTGNVIAANPEKLVVIKGINDYIVVDTPDALLIYPKTDEQQIRHIVDDIKQKFGKKYL